MQEYTAQAHWTLTIIGLILLIVIIFTLRAETSFLAISKKQRFQYVLSLISIFIMSILTIALLFHWSLPPLTTFVILIVLAPLLLILSPVILYLRAKSFKNLSRERLEEQKRLIIEVQEMIDAKKRQDIKDGKIARGEETGEA